MTRIGYAGKYILILIFLSFVFMPMCAGEGDVKDLKLFEYWENGKVKKCTAYDVNGYLKARAFCRHDGTVEKLEKFDHHGNKTETALYDEKGMLRTGIDGWAAMKWKYDMYQLVSETSFDEDGRPIETKYYSEGGKLMLRQYRNEDELFNPYEAASMAMMLGSRNVPCTVTERRVEQQEGVR